MDTLRRLGRVAVITAVLGLGVISGLLMHFEDSFIFFPTRGGVMRGAGTDVWLRADDGVQLHARLLETPNARRTLLYLHGNAGNLADRSELLALFATLGVHVLALEYRGYGLSAGEPSEAGLYRDAAAAYAWLRARGPASDIVVLGESLGGGPACELASTHEVGALVLMSTFTSIADMGKLSFPFLPVKLLVRTRFDNLGKIDRVRAPKLFIHSRTDEMIPFTMAERLFAAARAPKQPLWLDRSGHNNAFALESQRLMTGLRAFLNGLTEE